MVGSWAGGGGSLRRELGYRGWSWGAGLELVLLGAAAVAVAVAGAAACWEEEVDVTSDVMSSAAMVLELRLCIVSSSVPAVKSEGVAGKIAGAMQARGVGAGVCRALSASQGLGVLPMGGHERVSIRQQLASCKGFGYRVERCRMTHWQADRLP